jgi:hypothetical protein
MESKIVSMVTPDGYYAGAETAYPSPMEPGEFYMSPQAVDIEPPQSIPHGKVAKLNGDIWEFVNAPEVEEPVKYEAVEWTPEELALAKRAKLLSESDYVVLKAYEAGVKVPREWIIYRQWLRDITSQREYPENVAWPTKPVKA